MALSLSHHIKHGLSQAMKITLESSDEDLVKACISNDRLAQKYLYQRYFGNMLGICMRYTSNRYEAIEVLNEAFLRVFESLPNYQNQGKLSGWIARIVFRSTIDYVRANTSYKQMIHFQEYQEPQVENTALSNLAAEELYEVIQKLPPASRSVFNLYVVEGFKHAEIAQQLGISVGTSKWHLAQARKNLQFLIKGKDQ